MSEIDNERAEFSEYCKKNRVLFAYTPGSVDGAFEAWRQDRESEKRRLEEAQRKVRIIFKKAVKTKRGFKTIAELEFDKRASKEELENAVRCIKWLEHIHEPVIKAVLAIVTTGQDFVKVNEEISAFRRNTSL